MKIAVVINVERLTPELEQKLKSTELTEKYNIEYDTYFPESKDIDKVLSSIYPQTYQAILIGGGDGTVRSAIQILSASEVPIAILPLGTFNLLAKSLNYPNDIDKLFALIKNKKTKQIDFIDINDNVVINHATIGFYFYILKQRNKYKAFTGKSRLLKSMFNALTLTLFSVLPVYELEMVANGETVIYKTCLAYIGNNEFYNSLFALGERKSLSTGLFSVTILNARNRWQLFLCLINLLLGFSSASKYITYFCTDSLTVTAKSKLINIVIDGELFKLDIPLYVRNNKKQLKVLTD